MDSSNPPTDPTPATAAPLPASTVVLLRPTAEGEAEMFMVVRSAQSPFMPSTLVFPGGRVEGSDGPQGSDEAFVAAARRECLEEARLSCDHCPLHWFDTWITPSLEPRRFHARFYLALLQPGEGTSARADGHETLEGRWTTAEDVWSSWELAQADLPPPTLSVILRLRNLRFAEVQDLVTRLSTPSLDPQQPILPKWLVGDESTDREHRGRDQVVLPHDPEYPKLPGVAGPTPDRVHSLPPRFVRDGQRWLPFTP